MRPHNRQLRKRTRAVKWLLAQPGGSVVIVTPRRAVESASLKRLIALTHPGMSGEVFAGVSRLSRPV